MTREEAIEILRKNRPTSDPRLCGMELCDAVDMAIDALREQEGKDTYAPTNADRIRAMTDEELAEFIATTFENGRISVFAIYPELTENHCGLDWLQQPAEEDDHAICGEANLPCIRCNPGGCDNRKEGSDNDT